MITAKTDWMCPGKRALESVRLPSTEVVVIFYLFHVSEENCWDREVGLTTTSSSGPCSGTWAFTQEPRGQGKPGGWLF